MGQSTRKEEAIQEKKVSEIHIRILSSLLHNIKLHLRKLKPQADNPKLTTTRVLPTAKQSPELSRFGGRLSSDQPGLRVFIELLGHSAHTPEEPCLVVGLNQSEYKLLQIFPIKSLNKTHKDHAEQQVTLLLWKTKPRNL